VEEARRSRPLLAYQLPVWAAAVLVLAFCLYATVHLSEQEASRTAKELTASLARGVQAQVAGLVQDRVRMLKLLAARPDVVAAFAEPEGLRRLGSVLGEALPDARMVAAVSASWQDDRVLQAVAGSYAAADLFQSVMESRKVPPAQAIRNPKGEHLMVLGAPVVREGRLAGALVAAWPLDLLRKRVSALGLSSAYLVLEQVVGGARLTLAAGGDSSRKEADGVFDVPGTLWRVRYGAPPQAGLGWPVLVGLLGGGVFLLGIVGFVGHRNLVKDCRADMELMVHLVGAILKGSGAATPTPHLAEAAPALQRMARFAQACYAERKKLGVAPAAVHERGGEGGGMVVEEMERADVQENAPAPPELDEAQLPSALFSYGLVRGRAETDLDETVAQAIGLAVGSRVQDGGGHKVAVARDNRSSSDVYASALVAGLLASGCDVVDLGEAPTPLLNYALRNSDATSGVMVTGGHNPPEYNGFKIYIDGKPLMETELLELRQRILDGRFHRGAGRLEGHDFSGEYIAHLTADVQLVEPMKLVLDAGNGVAGPLAQRAFEALGCEVIPLYCEPDAGFPNHLPDPTDSTNLEALCQEVQAQGAQLGVALDMDGDALAVVDEQGRVVPPDALLMTLAGDLIRRNPGADVIYDVAGTARLPEFILANGGRPIMWRVGHHEIQAKLEESQGLLAGEFTGHLYLKDRWYGFDDGIYAAARLMELFSLNAVPVSQLVAPQLEGLTSTPLLMVEVPEGRAPEVVRRMAQEGEFGDADVIDLDGLRVEFEDAWGLVRPSHTRSALVFRFEGEGEEALAQVQRRFRSLLERVAPDLRPPF